ncbi:MAG: LLM class flavin-dependent oxidoreductase [Naasia sp.]
MTTRTGAIGVMLPRDLDPARVVEFSQRADGLGFDELWIVEDLGFRGGVAQTAVALAVTRNIRVGVGLLPTGARNVAYAAMEIATLAELFPGRVDIALGHGMPAWMRSVGAWPRSPLTLFGEYATALRALLAGDEVTSPATNRYVHLDGVRLDPATVPAHPPRLLGGMRGPRSLALAGRVADGTVLAEPTTPEYIEAARERMGAAGEHRLVGYNAAAVADDPEEALALIRPALEWIGEEDWEPHIAPLPFAAEFADHRREAASRADFAATLPAAWVEQLAVVGTPVSARARIDALFAAGLDSSVLIPAGPDPLEALDALARVL